MAETATYQHFELLRRPDGSLWELGRGAMGITYKAFDTNLRCDVALKVINSQYLHSETARQRFLREARAAAQLRHPNVASVFHLGHEGGDFFYAMEFIDGETVERRVQRDGPLPLDLGLRITRQVTRALMAADRHQLVHRDIKPSNIMLVRDEEENHLLVKVIDFGLAKSLVAAADQSVTVTLGGFVGTPHFASPEQLEEREIDVRSDLYSLGATLWFMLTGRPPFSGSMASVIHQHLGQPLPAEILGSLPPPVAKLLTRLLQKKAGDRFQTPTELKQALDDLLVELQGHSPTLAFERVSSAGPNTSTSLGYATGQLIRARYELLEQSRLEKTLFKAKDLQANRVVAIRTLPASANQSIESLQQEVSQCRELHHPNLLEVYGLEVSERGAVLVSEWVRGFTLQELLRSRRQLTWQETVRLVRPIAKALDFAAERLPDANQLLLAHAYLEFPRTTDNVDELLHLPVSNWPAFLVKIDPLSLVAGKLRLLAEPTQTLVGGTIEQAPVGAASQLALLIYELLGGSKMQTATGGNPRFTPLSSLTEQGNSTLRQGLTESARFHSAQEFLTQLEASADRPAADRPAGEKPAINPLAAAGKPNGARALPETPAASPVLKAILVGAAAFFVICLVGALILLKFFNDQPKPPGPRPVQENGSITLNTKPPGATVRWNGAEIGKTPLVGYSLPKGRQVLEVELAGYQTRPVEMNVEGGATLNLGTVPLVHEVGQLVLQSTPAGVSFEITDSDQRTISGTTPSTMDNLPSGKYNVRMKHPGWPDYVAQINLPANGTATVQHTFQGVSVQLKSDPSGATIFMGDQELGKAPLTVTLPPEQVELVSKIGLLEPVKQRITPDPDSASVFLFKHRYGTVLVNVDRVDAQVYLQGALMGKPPVQGILPPGPCQIVVQAPGAPDQSRTVTVEEGRQASVQINFTADTGAGNERSGPSPQNQSQNGKPDRDSWGEGLPSSGGDLGEATPTPASTPPPPRRTPRPTPTAQTYRSEEDYKRAREAAYDRFDQQWEARKRQLEKAKDYYDYMEDHSEGAAKDKWHAKKKAVEEQEDRLDDQKDAAKNALKRQWNDN